MKFSGASFDLCLKFVARCPFDIVHLLKCPRKNSKLDFEYSIPRILVRVRYHFKWFLKLYNLNLLDSKFIPWGRNRKKSQNSTYSCISPPRKKFTRLLYWSYDLKFYTKICVKVESYFIFRKSIRLGSNATIGHRTWNEIGYFNTDSWFQNCTGIISWQKSWKNAKNWWSFLWRLRIWRILSNILIFIKWNFIGRIFHLIISIPVEIYYTYHIINHISYKLLAMMSFESRFTT